MTEEISFRNVDKDYKLLIFEQKWQSLRIRYQIFVTALFTIEIGFIFGFIKRELKGINPYLDSIITIIISLTGLFIINRMFRKRFIELENNILTNGEIENVK